MKFNQKIFKPLKVLGQTNISQIMLKIVQFCMSNNFQCPVVNNNCRHLQQREGCGAHDCLFDNRVEDPLNPLRILCTARITHHCHPPLLVRRLARPLFTTALFDQTKLTRTIQNHKSGWITHRSIWSKVFSLK